jgi:hypothetical protein
MRFSTHGRALSASIQGHGSAPFASRVSRSAIMRSARCQTGQRAVMPCTGWTNHNGCVGRVGFCSRLQPCVFIEALKRVAHDGSRQEQLLVPVPHDVDVVLEPDSHAC